MADVPVIKLVTIGTNVTQTRIDRQREEFNWTEFSDWRVNIDKFRRQIPAEL